MFQGNKIAFIGAGIMGGTMIERLIDNKMVTPEQIISADPQEARGHELVAKLGIQYTPNNIEAVEGADVLVLSVKPQQLERALHEIRGRADSIPLISSIVAGIKI